MLFPVNQIFGGKGVEERLLQVLFVDGVAAGPGLLRAELRRRGRLAVIVGKGGVNPVGVVKNDAFRVGVPAGEDGVAGMGFARFMQLREAGSEKKDKECCD
ncbi:MAG: hypothetical protein J5I94_20575 [Phaeodactylibacter sp.]|nr:hypothetical protein [Phaeodactylibacter sp.]